MRQKPIGRNSLKRDYAVDKAFVMVYNNKHLRYAKSFRIYEKRQLAKRRFLQWI